MQSPLWALHKSQFSWDAYPIEICSKTEMPLLFVVDKSKVEKPESLVLLVLVRNFAGKFRLAYIPHAPSVNAIALLQKQSGVASPSAILEMLAKLISQLIPPCLFIRLDLDWPIGDSPNEADKLIQDLQKSNLRKSRVNIQAPDTTIIDIAADTRSEDDILRAMKSKTRYNIRLAQKHGVNVVKVSRANYEIPEELGHWYAMYQITEKRNSISLHEELYYARLFSLSSTKECRLYLAYHNNDLLAGIVVVGHGTMAYYLYGASTNEKRNLMPMYALQWKAMCDMRAEGFRHYDMFGIPSPIPFNAKKQGDSAGGDSAPLRSDPMFGLYQFKIGFGGRIVSRPGSWDIPQSPLYYLYRIIEKFRMYYYRVYRKRNIS